MALDGGFLSATRNDRPEGLEKEVIALVVENRRQPDAVFCR